MTTANIVYILGRWGAARAVSECGALGYPRQSAFARLMRSSGSWALADVPLRDDEHELVDAAVSRLKARHPGWYEVVLLAYVCRWTDSRIARELREGRGVVRERRMSAEAYLDGVLSEVGLVA